MADETLNGNDGTLNARAGSLGGTYMRYHELALQRWLNQLFFVREGYPVPVVFTSPMDAFSYFAQLWSDDTNPFAYLLNLKDANGTPFYEPHPSPVRYPIISVHRKSWKIRPYQNFSIHRWRHINWPTVANAGTYRYGPEAQGWDMTKCQLGNVTTSRMPMAWNYRFQIDHFCNRPDTQAFFVEQLMQEFWRTGGQEPQTWITVPYPGWGNRRVRLYLDGDIESLTPEEPEDGKNVEFRTSFTVVVEGFDVDLRYEVYPALWELVLRFGPVDPIQLEDCFNITKEVDLRVKEKNPSIDLRPNIPMAGTCQQEIWNIGAPEQTTISVVGINETANNGFGVFTIGSTVPVFLITGSVTQNGSGMTTPLAVDNVGTVVSDAVTGSYGVNVTVGYSGVIQPVFTGGAFIPPYRVYVGVGTNLYNQDYAFQQAFIEVSSTEAGSVHGGFVFGSADLFVYGIGATGAVGFVSGTLLDASVFAGTLTDQGTNAVSFWTGTLADTILRTTGTDYSSGTVSFATGTLFDAIVHAGTYFESGTTSVTFVDGTLAQLMILAAQPVEQTSLQVGFLGGTLV